MDTIDIIPLPSDIAWYLLHKKPS